MKILHTSDWHLGIKTDGRNRIEEQKLVMAELVDEAVNNDVDIVIVSGDVFHHSVPSSEAEDLFYSTLERFTCKNDRVVVVLAGNHDDPKRLLSNVYFTKKHRIVLAGDFEISAERNTDGKVRIEEVGKGYVQITKYLPHLIESATVAILPYPMEYRLGVQTTGESYADKVREWARIPAMGFKRNTFNIFASHIMLASSVDSNNGKLTELKVGDIHTVSTADLPFANYYALGHIHTNQIIKGNFVYSGAPMLFDYDHKKAGYYLVETFGSSIKSLEYKQLKLAKKMERIKVNSIEEAENILKTFDDDDIIELTFVQKTPLASSTIKQLKKNFPCVLGIKLELIKNDEDNANGFVNRNKLNSKQLFIEFYKQKKGATPDDSLVELFVNLMDEVTDDETN